MIDIVVFRAQIIRIIGQLLVRGANVPDCQPVRLGKVKQGRVLGPVNRAKDILGAGLGLDLEFEGAILGRFTRKVNIVNLIETNVNGRLNIKG